MSSPLNFSADWEYLGEGSAEERACFAAIGIQRGTYWLTEMQDELANRLRQKPLLSGYRLAEWLALNWWRLRWEPSAGAHRESRSWRFAHRTASIGGGWVWPDITIFSDGYRTSLVPKPDRAGATASFRYLGADAIVVPSSSFETSVDEFLGQILERLDAMSVKGSELEQLWKQLCEERADAGHARFRKLEALLGLDPDEASSEIITQLVNDQQTLGMNAVDELAADAGADAGADLTGSVQSAITLSEMAQSVGFSSSSIDLPKLPLDWKRGVDLVDTRAWIVGARAAQAIRAEIGNIDDPISSQKLCSLAGVSATAVAPNASRTGPISFEMGSDSGRGQIVLRAKQESGRRFELARILCDKLIAPDDRLHPATRAYTYRQKTQRAFAAELLSPFQAMFNRLQGDYSLENQTDIADEFSVSQWTINTQLVNNRILDRDALHERGVNPG